MNAVIGRKGGFPVYSGPCQGCGRVNYGLLWFIPKADMYVYYEPTHWRLAPTTV